MLPTICELTDVDEGCKCSSSCSSSPDSVAMIPSSHHQALDSLPPLPHLFKRRHSPPVGVLMLSERRMKLRKAAANVDYEMKRLNHQITLAQQYTDDVIAMRIEQTRMEERIKQERSEIAARHLQLIEDLRRLANDAAEISRADAEVTVLQKEYAAEKQSLEEMKAKFRMQMEFQRKMIDDLKSGSSTSLVHQCERKREKL